MGICRPAQDFRLAAGFSAPEDIAIDERNVYITDIGDNTVWKISQDGGAKQSIATNQAKPYRVAVDDQYVYWTCQLGGAILRRRKDLSDTVVPILSAQGPTGLVVDSTHIYWFNSGDMSFYRSPKNDLSTKTRLYTMPDMPDELIDGGARVYFSSRFTHVGTIDKSTLDVTVGEAAAIGMFYGVAADDSGTYSALLRAAGDNIATPWGTVTLPPGGRPKTMRSDGCRLFYTTGAAALYYVRRGFTVPVKFADGAAVESNRIAIGADGLYFTDAGFVGHIQL
jgi:hypothetical protein